MDCLGITHKFMEQVKKPKNNYLSTPTYLLENSISYKSLKKLYKLSEKKIPKTNISPNGEFYRIFWDKNLILKV